MLRDRWNSILFKLTLENTDSKDNQDFRDDVQPVLTGPLLGPYSGHFPSHQVESVAKRQWPPLALTHFLDLELGIEALQFLVEIALVPHSKFVLVSPSDLSCGEWPTHWCVCPQALRVAQVVTGMWGGWSLDMRARGVHRDTHEQLQEIKEILNLNLAFQV